MRKNIKRTICFGMGILLLVTSLPMKTMADVLLSDNENILVEESASDVVIDSYELLESYKEDEKNNEMPILDDSFQIISGKIETDKVISSDNNIVEGDDFINIEEDDSLAIKPAYIDNTDNEVNSVSLGSGVFPIEIIPITQLTDFNEYKAIHNRKELEGIFSNPGGKYYLANDIDLSGEEWNPIGNRNRTGSISYKDTFYGVLDGQGHAIKNFTRTSYYNAGDTKYNGNVGLFECISNYGNSDTVIKNISFENVMVDIEHSNIVQFSTLAGSCRLYGKNYNPHKKIIIDNVITNGTVSADTCAGIIVGENASFYDYSEDNYEDIVISNCINRINFSRNAGYTNKPFDVGGISTVIRGSISNCVNYGNIESHADSFSDDIGGVAGWSRGGNISDCVNYGSFISKSNGNLGGIASRSEVGGVIKNCRNEGSITQSEDVAGNNVAYTTGGIIGGYCDSIENCTNNGTVIGKTYVGGIAGTTGNGDIISCTNNADIEGLNSIGGIVGEGYASIKSCTNNGEVRESEKNTKSNSNKGIGGILGSNNDSSARGCVYECENKGTVSAISNICGGIAGYSTAKVEKSSNSGNVISNGGDAYSKYTGGIVGSMFRNSIIQCNNSGIVSTDYKTYHNEPSSLAGGVCGYLTCGIVDDCGNSGEVFNGGGIVGISSAWGDSICEIKNSENNGSISGEYAAGILCVGANTALQSCTNKADVSGDVASGIIYMDKIINMDSGCSVVSCVNFGNIQSNSEGFSGGIGGTVALIDDCQNYGDILYDGSVSAKGNGAVGGIAGKVTTITNCTNFGSVSQNSYYCNAGGIAGETASVESCENNGEISGCGYVGGIAGSADNVLECANRSDVKSKDFAAGIVGYISGSIKRSINEGDIYAEAASGRIAAAGIAVTAQQFIANSSEITESELISDCYNAGNIYAKEDNATSNSTTIAGGILGYYTDSHYIKNGQSNPYINVLIKNCYSVGHVYSGTGKAGIVLAGGIVGALTEHYMENYAPNATIISCMALQGNITADWEAGMLSDEKNFASAWAIGNGLYNSGSHDNLYRNDKLGEEYYVAADGMDVQEFYKKKTYSDRGWDFDSIWKIPSNGGLPGLRWTNSDNGIYMEDDQSIKYTINFVSNGGSKVRSIQVVEDRYLYDSIVIHPTKAGYEFVGWYQDYNLLVPYDYTKPVVSDMILYAKWKEAKFTGEYNDVSMDVNGNVQHVKWGLKIFGENEATEGVWLKNLAYAGIYLSNSIEKSKNDGDRALEKLGFTDNKDGSDFSLWDQFIPESPAYRIGSREVSINGEKKLIVAVVVRGTNGPIDAIYQDLLGGGFNGFLQAGINLEEKVTSYLSTYYKSYEKDDVVFFITGHSLGGACAGQLARQLNTKGKYPLKNTFVYTYASPYYDIQESIDRTNYRNIYNFINVYDVVTTVPALYAKRAGVDLYYCNDPELDWMALAAFSPLKMGALGAIAVNGNPHHACDRYMYCISNGVPESDIRYIISYGVIECPVDVYIYDEIGQLIGYTRGEEFYNKDKTNILIYTEGDKKNFYWLDDANYIVKLVGTGDGEMSCEFGVTDTNSSTNIVISKFDTVILNENKEFQINYSDDDISMYVTDDSGEPIKQVLEDGTEIDYSKYGDVLPEDVPEDGIIPNGLWCAGVVDKEYTGNAILQDVRIYNKMTLLKEKTDYTLSYKNNTNVASKDSEKNPPTITVTGKGNYKGTETQTFSITAKKLSDPDVTVSEIASQKYNKKNQTPVPTVTYYKKKLANNKDFVVAYYTDKSCKNAATPKEPGKYYVKLTGKGNFTGSRVVEFVIAAVDEVPVSKLTVGKIADQLFDDGKEIKPEPVVKDGKKVLTKGTDYKLTYKDNKGIGTASIVITGVKAKGYVGTRTVTFKITGTSIKKVKLTGFVSSFEYSGQPIAQTIKLSHTVKKGQPDKVLRQISKDAYDALDDNAKLNYDCTVEYADNKDIGTAMMTVTGVNGYFDKITKTYKITGTSISKATVGGAFTSSFVYDGTEKTQAGVKLSYKKNKNDAPRELKGILKSKYDALSDKKKAAYDYTISYDRNVNAGTATMLMTGVNNWYGTNKKTFKITQFDINKNEGNKISITLNGDSYLYAKSGSKPKPIVRFGDTVLTEGVDYTLSYSNNTAVNDGTGKKVPTVKVTGKGNFTKTNDKTRFKITPADMETAGLQISTGNVIYKNSKGNWKTTVSVVEPDGKKLAVNKDYTVKYTYDAAGDNVVSDKDIVQAGKDIYVHVTAKGGSNYSGGIRGSYHIYKYDINKLTASLEPKTYTGKPVKLTNADITWKSGKTVLNDVTVIIDESTYKNNVNKGSASVTVKGTGECAGSKKITYTIGARNILWWWRNLLN